MSVVLLAPGKKEPAIYGGSKDYTDNPEQIEAWWGFGRHPHTAPDFNVGVVCGEPSGGLIIIDVDDHDADGFASLREFEITHGKLPETVKVITGSHGRHYYYRTSRKLRPFANVELGIDLRAEGSYALIPPSIHPNGELYEFAASFDDCEIAQANDTVYELIDWITPRHAYDPATGTGERFKLPEKIGKGGRNDTLFRYACSLRSIHRGRDEIFNGLVGVNATRCEEPLSIDEIGKIADSAMHYDEKDEGKAAGGGEDEEGEYNNLGLRLPLRNKSGAVVFNTLADIILQDDCARYIDGVLMVWNGCRWTADDNDINLRSRLRAPDVKSAVIEEVYKYLRDMAPRTYSGQYEGNFIQFANGTLDLDTMREVEPTPDMLITSTLAVELKPGIERNEADDFLDAISCGDEATKKAMLQVILMSMLPKKLIKQAVMCVGKADAPQGNSSNGKSSFTFLIQRLVGRANYSTLSLQQLGSDFMPAQLRGMLVNIGDDLPATFVDNNALSMFKQSVTGEEITANIKGKKPMVFAPSATFIYSMNTIPHLADVGGIERRLKFIIFRAKFEPDKVDIREVLRRPEVLSRVAWLALKEYPELARTKRYASNEEMDNALAEVMTDNDPVMRWAKLVGVSKAKLDGKEVSYSYDRYVEWTKAAQERPMSLSTFGKLMVQKVFVDEDDGQKFKLISVRGTGGRHKFQAKAV